MAFPSTACLIQHKLGIPKVACFDIEAACSGFLYALDVADGMLSSNRYQVCISGRSGKAFQYNGLGGPYHMCFFGDGAGAAVLTNSGEGPQLIGFKSGADGSNPNLLHQPAGGSLEPASQEPFEAGAFFKNEWT